MTAVNPDGSGTMRGKGGGKSVGKGGGRGGARGRGSATIAEMAADGGGKMRGGKGGGKDGGRGDGRGSGKGVPSLALRPAGQARSPDPRELNELLGRTELAQELLDLHRQFGHSFERVNLATCWSRLGRVSPAERAWLRSNEDEGVRLQTWSVSTTAHAMAKLAILGPAWGSL